MKKLFTLMFFLSFLAVFWGQAGAFNTGTGCTQVNGLAPEILAITRSTSYVIFDATGDVVVDSGLQKAVLLIDENNPPTTHQDSLTAGIADRDSILITGLVKGTTYYFRYILTDSVETCTTAVNSVTKTGNDFTFGIVDTSHSFVSLKFTQALLPDSAFSKYVLLFDTSNPPTTRLDSVTTGHTSPDTLIPIGLTDGTTYYARIIATDSTGTDTSQTSSGITTPALPDTVTPAIVTAHETQTSLKVRWVIPSAGIDSALKKVVTEISTDSLFMVRKDSIITSVGYTDTSNAMTGLTAGSVYYYRIIISDSTATCTTAIQSYTKRQIIPVCAEVNASTFLTTHSHAHIKITPTLLPDSAWGKITLLADQNNPPTTHTDSVTSSVTSPDTLIAGGYAKDVTTIYVRAIMQDSLSTDTSEVVAVTLDANFGWTGVADLTDSVTHSMFVAKAGFTAGNVDSSLKKLVLVYDTDSDITGGTRIDSVTTVTNPDTLRATGLSDTTKYYFWFIGTDSTATDTSAVDSATTKNFQVVHWDVELLAQHTALALACSTINADSGNQKMVVQWGTSNPPTTRKDSVTTTGTNPDTILATGLAQNTKYYFRWIVSDSTVTETTAVDSATTLNLTQTITVIDTTTSHFKLKVDPNTPDSGIKKIVVLLGTTNPPTAHANDSIVGATTDPDTVQVNGLTHQTKYYFKVVLSDSAFTDTSAVDSVTTEGMTITLACVDSTYRDFTIQITYSNIDSAAKLIVMERGADATLDSVGEEGGDWVRADSDLTALVSPDTLNATSGTMDLTPQTLYGYRVIITDSTQTDTAYVGPGSGVYTEAFPYPTDYDVAVSLGGYSPNQDNQDTRFTYGAAGTYTKSTYTLAPVYWIGPFSWFSIRAILFGEDNNHLFDSTSIHLQTKWFGDWTTIATIVDKDPDTVTTTLKQYLLNPVDMGDTTLYWGDSLRVQIDISDSSSSVGDTATLDLRGYEYWIEFKK